MRSGKIVRGPQPATDGPTDKENNRNSASLFKQTKAFSQTKMPFGNRRNDYLLWVKFNCFICVYPLSLF